MRASPKTIPNSTSAHLVHLRCPWGTRISCPRATQTQNSSLPLGVHVNVFFRFHQFLLGLLQQLDRLFGVPAKFNSLVGCLCLLDMSNCRFGSFICVPEVGVMEFKTKSGGGDKCGE